MELTALVKATPEGWGIANLDLAVVVVHSTTGTVGLEEMRSPTRVGLGRERGNYLEIPKK